jgi:hypothetical protein
MKNGSFRHVGGDRSHVKRHENGAYTASARELEPPPRDERDYLEDYARAGAEDGLHTFDMEPWR